MIKENLAISCIKAMSTWRKVNWKRSIKIILAETTERVEAEL